MSGNVEGGRPGEATTTAVRRVDRVSIPVVELPVGVLKPSPHQPRRHPSRCGLEELAQSIASLGVLEPLCVRPLDPPQHEIIAGERRWRAAMLAKMPSVPCRVFRVNENEAFVMALAENLQRRDLSPLEEAQGYQEMLRRGIARNRAAIARLLGVTRPRITQRMKLLELDASVVRKETDGSSIEVFGLLIKLGVLNLNGTVYDPAVLSTGSSDNLTGWSQHLTVTPVSISDLNDTDTIPATGAQAARLTVEVRDRGTPAVTQTYYLFEMQGVLFTDGSG